MSKEKEQELPDLDKVDIEEEQGIIITDIDRPTIDQITVGNKGWQDYIMSQFRSEELQEGKPTCDGLRRVTEAFIGPITSKTITELYPPNENNNYTSTVVVRIQVLVTKNASHPHYGKMIIEDEAADVNKSNTDAPYCYYQSATATTRAEARALRKILKLRTVAAEEVGQGVKPEESTNESQPEVQEVDWTHEEPIGDEQITCLDVVCRRCNINVMDYINAGTQKYENIRQVSKEKARKMIQHINSILQGKAETPQGVGTYESNWKT